jgi:hypothetical protein
MIVFEKYFLRSVYDLQSKFFIWMLKGVCYMLWTLLVKEVGGKSGFHSYAQSIFSNYPTVHTSQENDNLTGFFFFFFFLREHVLMHYFKTLPV